METRNQLKSFFTDHWKYMAVSAACKLDVFDHLADQPLTSTELAAKTGYHETNLGLLLQGLTSFDFLIRNDQKFGLSELSEFLTNNHPESLKYAAMNWSGEHLTAWQQLDYTVRTGGSSFENLFGIPYFQYLSQNPDKESDYQDAIGEYARDDYRNLPDLVDFGIHQTLMDVGGGSGMALGFIKDTYPKTECILFDLEGVVQKCSHPGIVRIAGDFFTEIPTIGADGILLCRVLHDWNDEKARIILSNCLEAMKPGGILYVVENGDPDPDVNLSLLSLNMAVMCQSRERSQADIKSIKYFQINYKAISPIHFRLGIGSSGF